MMAYRAAGGTYQGANMKADTFWSNVARELQSRNPNEMAKATILRFEPVQIR